MGGGGGPLFPVPTALQGKRSCKAQARHGKLGLPHEKARKCKFEGVLNPNSKHHDYHVCKMKEKSSTGCPIKIDRRK